MRMSLFLQGHDLDHHCMACNIVLVIFMLKKFKLIIIILLSLLICAWLALKTPLFERSTLANKHSANQTFHNPSDKKDHIENLKRKFKKLKKSTDSDASDILAEISRLAGFEETVKFLKSEISDPQILRFYMGDIYSHVEEPMSVTLDRINSISEEDCSSHMSSFIMRLGLHDFTKEDIASFLTNDRFNKHAQSYEGSLVLLISSYDIGNDPNHVNRIKTVVATLAEIKKSSATSQVIKMLGEGSRFRGLYAWELAQDLIKGSFLNDAQKSDLRRQILGNLAKVDPENALKLILKEPTAHTQENMGILLREWASQSERAPQKWLDSGNVEATAFLRASVDAGRAANMVSNNRYREAMDAVQNIPDLQHRTRFVNEFNNLESFPVKKEVQADPVKFMNDMSAGQSRFSDRAMETAMSTWIKSDPVAAETWYKNNINSLDPERSQYIAAAYAMEAVRQRDLSNATIWAGSIQDEITRSRVLAEIEKLKSN